MSSKKVIEYKKHLTPSGLVNPPWLIAGDLFYDSVSKTYIGLVLDEENRDYYIPDTVTYLSKQQFKDRLAPLHEIQPFRIKPNGAPDRIDATLDEFVNYWWDKNCD